ncbi:MAG: T9SS type A sorting domain-containing protein, partial [Candidatus Cloacimonadaceae bacterium]|nr:T9SS type A sorting domain-containing protein [Candidatus Cloacimonadaceae bacterium]
MGCYEYDSLPFVSNSDPVEQSPGMEFIGSAYPNPFKDQVNIHYKLTQAAKVNILIYNLKGQLVKTLINDRQSKGDQFTRWEGMDESGRKVASGIYLLRFSIDGKQRQIRRLVLLR